MAAVTASVLLRSRKGLRLLIGAILLFAIVATAFWWQAHERAAILRAAVPPRPDFTGWPAEFVQRVAFDETRSLAGRDQAAAFADLAQLYHANGFLDEARRCYHALIAADVAAPRERYRLATLESGTGELRRAEALFRAVIADERGYLPARLRLGDLLLKDSRREEAERVFEEAIQAHPNDPYARLGLARCAMEKGDWHTARQFLEAVITTTHYELGVDLIVTVYEQLGLNDRAEAVRGRMKAWGAFQDMPDPWLEELNADSYDAYRLSLASGVAKRRGDLDQALVYLKRAATLSPANAMMQFELGRLLIEMRQPQEARAAFEKCTELSPQFPDGWAYLCGVLEASGDAAAGAQVLARGLANCPDSPGLHHMRAKRHQAAGRFDAAIADYRRAIQLRPTEADAHIELATLLFRMNRIDDGIAELHAALQAEPEQPMALCLLGLHAINRGDAEDARKWIVRARNQPRVVRDDITRLMRSFERAFGIRP